MEIISSGDTWATIAVRTGVDEARLREVNKGRPFENGRALIIPDENIGAVPPPSSSEARPLRGADDGLVDVVPEVLDPPDGDHAGPLTEPAPPRAVVVAEPAARASGRTHKVKAGETLWRISSRYKVDQRKLMELNGIKDPNKLAAGATLKIPE
jgi:LysM repeat protein